MSLVDHSQRPLSDLRGWTDHARALATRATHAIVATPWVAWRNRPLRLAIAWALAAWIVLQGAFLIWLHRHAEGVSHRAFLPGAVFALTEMEAAADLHAVSEVGYDGQHYYRMSNDVFGRRDAYKHVDTPLYRYQRIGIPMLAGGISSLLGFSITPPLLYHTLQFGITSIGFGAVVYWLLLNRLSPAYALGWLLSGGTLFSLWLGLLDAPGDAIFALTILAVLAGRLWWYAPLASLLLLTREGYIVYAFAIFAMTAASHVAWRDKQGRRWQLVSFAWCDVNGFWKPLVLTAIPGVVMLAWTGYLTVHFGMSPLEARANPDATNWPYTMMVEYARVFYDKGNWFELRLLLVSAFTLVLISILLVKNFRRAPLALVCALPYVLLTAALGKMVWEAYGGHVKASGSLILLGMFLLPFDKSLLLRFMLAAQAIVGLDLMIDTRVMHAGLLSPQVTDRAIGRTPNPPGAPDNSVLSDLRSSVEWVDPQPVMKLYYRGFWKPVQRELRPITVAVTNHSETHWHPGLGKHPIWIGYRLYDENQRLLTHHAVLLDQPLAPGDTKHFSVPLDLWRANRAFVVEFSLRQEGPGWFAEHDPSYGRRYQFRVE